jgi:hypothetical protein
MSPLPSRYLKTLSHPLTDNIPTYPRIAYAFLVHNEATIAGMVESISLLYTQTDVFLIHVDAKVSQALFEETDTMYSNIPNVHLLKFSYNCQWGQIEIIVRDAVFCFVCNFI